ncbi:MAG: hypothetical protein WB706_08140, partial [Nitrososphaeraceae archaeon]
MFTFSHIHNFKATIDKAYFSLRLGSAIPRILLFYRLGTVFSHDCTIPSLFIAFALLINSIQM